MSYRCCVKGCNNTNNINCRPPNVYYDDKFVRMPKEPKRLKAWNAVLQLTGDRHRYVCAAHFAPSAWRTQDIIMNVPPKHRKLKENAMPTLKLPKKKHPTSGESASQSDEDTRKDLMELPTKENSENAAMDEETRKKLIAEALESYEKEQEAKRTRHNLVKSSKKTEFENQQFECRAKLPIAIISNEDSNESWEQCSEKETELIADDLPVPCEENPLKDIDPDAGIETSAIAPPSPIPKPKQKCGEIFLDDDVSLSFQFNCAHCCTLFDDFTAFKTHINDMHSKAKKTTTLTSIVATTDALKQPILIEPLQEQSVIIRSGDNVDTANKNHSANTALQSYEEIAKNMPFATCHISIFDLIELYEQHAGLWKTTSEQYKGKLKNEVLMANLYEKVSKTIPMELVATYDNLVCLLEAMNVWFTAEKWLRLHAKETAKPYESQYPHFYEALRFLEKHVPPFSCEICKHVYHAETAYMWHINPARRTLCATRLRGILHTCEFCQMRFARPANLACHRRQHTNERPFKCKRCDKKFRNLSTLQRHQWTHTKTKPHKCDNCERAYHTKYLLRMHQKSHLNIRDVICDICGKSFTLNKYLRRHKIAVHTTDADWTCKICGGIFKPLQMFVNHTKSCALIERNVRVIKSPKTVQYKNVEDLDTEETTLEHTTTTLRVHQVKTIVRADKNHITSNSGDNTRALNEITDVIS